MLSFIYYESCLKSSFRASKHTRILLTLNQTQETKLKVRCCCVIKLQWTHDDVAEGRVTSKSQVMPRQVPAIRKSTLSLHACMSVFIFKRLYTRRGLTCQCIARKLPTFIHHTLKLNCLKLPPLCLGSGGVTRMLVSAWFSSPARVFSTALHYLWETMHWIERIKRRLCISQSRCFPPKSLKGGRSRALCNDLGSYLILTPLLGFMPHKHCFISKVGAILPKFNFLQ